MRGNMQGAVTNTNFIPFLPGVQHRLEQAVYEMYYGRVFSASGEVVSSQRRVSVDLVSVLLVSA